MRYKALFYFKAVSWLLLVVLTFAACNTEVPTAAPSAEATTDIFASSSPASTEVQATQPPTSTAAPLAVVVNAESISLTEYQIELALFQAAKQADLTEEDKSRVMDNLIEQSLLAQAAQENGASLDEASLETRIQQLAEQIGGMAALEDWIHTQGYSPELFRQVLSRSLLAAQMRDQITNAVPKETEQILARQILVYTKEEADEIYALLKAGNDFGNLALQYNPITGGNLLWFPRGYLPDKNLEEAIFKLQPGEFTPVIETLAGFHIVQIQERAAERPLEADALQVLQTKAIQEWLEKSRTESQIQVLAP